jgi:energy-coupling factor transporter ATP-binding protein EcfA2
MQLAAIWVQNHHLLGTTGINLGGEYFYAFELEDRPDETTNILKVSRKKNEKYIANFYSDDSKNLSLTSAIVGRNGAGKSTILKMIRKIIHRETLGGYINAYDFAYLIFEHPDDSISIKTNSYRSKLGHDQRDEHDLPKELIPDYDSIVIVPELPKVETIYFSPFLDLWEFHFNYDDSPDIDISTDALIHGDTNSIDRRTGRNYLINHRYENLYRHIDFQKSAIAQKLIQEYDVPQFDKIYFTLSPPNVLENEFHNTPNGFRRFYSVLYKIWQREIYSTSRQVLRTSPLEEDKYIFKTWFLLNVIRTLFAPLESSNQYLLEGRARVEPNDLEKLPLKNALYIFLDNHYFEGFENVSLPIEETKELIEVAFSIIDSLDKLDIYEPKKMSLDFDKSIPILKLHSDFLNKLYHFDRNATGFLDVSLGSRNFSSGEKAFLDLYSRFFYGIQTIKKRKDDQYEGGLPKFFILLLDEGDLGFHPVWKKKFVKSITDILPNFFEEFEDTQVQIIFTTHDALTLSDMPNYNVVYLDKIDDQITVLNPLENEGRPTKSFGANISELLADSFFLKGGLVGDFAVEKIDKTIEWLLIPKEKDEFNRETQEYHRKVIALIDEPIIHRKLAEMFTEKTGRSVIEEQSIESQIETLQKRLNDLKNKR